MAFPLAVSHDPERDAVGVVFTPPASTARVQLWRSGPSRVVGYVRGWAPPGGAISAPGQRITRDYEAALGVPLDYQARAYNAAGTLLETSPLATITVPSDPADDAWLVDLARPLNSRQVLVESLVSLEHELPSQVHRVLNRRSPIVTQDIAWTFSGKLVVLTLSLDDRDAIRENLGNGVPMLMRTDPLHGVGNVYLSVLSWTQTRVSRLAQHPERRFTMDVVQVDRPDPALYVPIAPATYLDVKAKYATYTALKAGRGSYDAMLYDYAQQLQSLTPWPPRDV